MKLLKGLTILLLTLATHQVFAAIPAEERAALIAFYNSTHGDNWNDNSGWLGESGTECDWKGLSCFDSEHIGDIFLPSNGLNGTIPSELAQLSQLIFLRLDNNQLTGGIPSEVGQLPQLERLILNNNQLTGTIQLGPLFRLTDLNVSQNCLTIDGSLSGFLDDREKEQRADCSDIPLARDINFTIPVEEREALIAFYNAVGAKHWPITGGWLGEPGTECSWKGVACATGSDFLHVESIVIDTLLKRGELPSELGNLSQLKYFELNSRQLTGDIPAELGQLSQLISLRLGDSSSNKFGQISVFGLAGHIPPELGNLSQLISLDLGGNQLTGVIPPELGQLSQLKFLSINSENLINIPAELGQLSQLTELILTSNNPTDSTFAELNQLSTLRELTLINIPLTAAVGQLPELKNLTLTGSHISPEVGQLSKLERFSSRDVIGDIPPEIGQLSQLKYFHIGVSSQITGTIPAELGQLSQLKELVIHHTQLTGGLPPELGQLSQLESIRIESNNQLIGTIPAELGKLFNLEGLFLSNNRLTGGLPAELGKLAKLRRFLVHNNQLTGEIPPELGQLNLSHFFIGRNCFTFESPVKINALEQGGNAGQSNCPTAPTPTPELSSEQQAVSIFDDKKGLLVIKEVNAAGLVYYVELQDQGEFQFLLTKVTGLSDSVHKTPASYSFESLLVDIPSVFAFGKLYTIQMKNNGSNVFFITKVEVE